MKKYQEVEIIISTFNVDDVILASRPDGDNNLPFVPVFFEN